MSGNDRNGDPNSGRAPEPSHHWIAERDRLIQLWARAPSWTLDEGVELAFNRDPRNLINYGGSYARVRDSISHYYEMAKRARWTDQLTMPITPAKFVAWASGVGLEFDPAWFAAVGLQGDHEATIGTQGQHRSGRQSDDVDAEAGSALLSASVVSEVDQNQLNPNARLSLLKLVIGMAVAGYRFEPSEMRSAATKEISDDLERLGIPLNRDTILKWLREGAELLPSEPRDDDQVHKQLM